MLMLGIARVTKGLWRGLVAFGESLVGGFPRGGEQDPLAGPFPGHPERLRTDVPLSALERQLMREMPMLRDLPPTRSFW
jgi:hypothetical protein